MRAGTADFALKPYMTAAAAAGICNNFKKVSNHRKSSGRLLASSYSQTERAIDQHAMKLIQQAYKMSIWAFNQGEGLA